MSKRTAKKSQRKQNEGNNKDRPEVNERNINERINKPRNGSRQKELIKLTHLSHDWQAKKKKKSTNKQ